MKIQPIIGRLKAVLSAMLGGGIGIESPVRFVLLFEGRSGSTHVISSLNSHPDIAARGEIFVGKSAAEQKKEAEGLFKNIVTPVTGFKTKLRDVADMDWFTEMLRRYDARIVHLRRRNEIKGAISRLNGVRIEQVYGTWNLSGDMEPLGPFSPKIEEVQRMLEWRRRSDDELEEFLRGLVLKKQTFWYEDLLHNSAGFFASLFEFLGCKPMPVTSRIKKNTKDDLRQVLLNFDELRAHFAGTKYEGMWDE